MYARIKKLRESLNLTQAEFGNKIGVSRDTISNIEQNRIEIKDIYIVIICAVFGINKDWLLSGKGKMYTDDQVTAKVKDIMSGNNKAHKAILCYVANASESEINTISEIIDNIHDRISQKAD